MKKTILAAALALALPSVPVWAQAPEQKAVAATPAETAKPAPKAKTAKARKSSSTIARRHMDARHCLERPTNDAIIRCAEEYL